MQSHPNGSSTFFVQEAREERRPKGRFVRILWGVAPTDPTTLATVAGLLLGVAVVASWIPARMAPVEALSYE